MISVSCYVYVRGWQKDLMSISELLPLSFVTSRKNSFFGAAELCLFNVISPTCDGDFCHLLRMEEYIDEQTTCLDIISVPQPPQRLFPKRVTFAWSPRRDQTNPALPAALSETRGVLISASTCPILQQSCLVFFRLEVLGSLLVGKWICPPPKIGERHYVRWVRQTM
jgi:hypothetical protein